MIHRQTERQNYDAEIRTIIAALHCKTYLFHKAVIDQPLDCERYGLVIFLTGNYMTHSIPATISVLHSFFLILLSLPWGLPGHKHLPRHKNGENGTLAIQCSYSLLKARLV